MTSAADMRHIYDEWTASLRRRDVARLAALYAMDAVFESPAVLLLGDRFDGEIEGREEIASFFDAFFDRIDNAIADWLRTGDLFIDESLVTWDQVIKLRKRGGAPRTVETVEAVELEAGLIVRHRVFWNWAGLKMLRSELPSERRPRRVAPLILTKSDR